MKRTILPTIAVLLSWLLVDALAHRLLLQSLYAASPSVWRPVAELSAPLAILATLILALVFVILYGTLVVPKSVGKGLLTGGLLGVALGTASGLGTYIHSPISAELAWSWWALGVFKGLLAGAILGALLTDKAPDANESSSTSAA